MALSRDFYTQSDDTVFNNFKEDAAKAAEGSGDGIPTFFLEEGSYWLRFYPDLVDMDGAQKLVVMREFWCHGFPAGKARRSIPCEGKGCRFCELSRPLVEAKCKDAFRWKSEHVGIARAHIFRTTVPNTSKYVKADQPVFILFNWFQIKTFHDWVRNQKTEHIRAMLNPFQSDVEIEITYVKGKKKGEKGVFSFGFGRDQATLPELPEDFPGLYEHYFDPKAVGTDEEYMLFRAETSKLLQSVPTNVVDPPTTEYQSGTTISGESRRIAQEAAQQVKREPVTISVAPVRTLECPSDDPKLKFGDHPTESHLDCDICPHESECRDATMTADELPF